MPWPLLDPTPPWPPSARSYSRAGVEPRDGLAQAMTEVLQDDQLLKRFYHLHQKLLLLGRKVYEGENVKKRRGEGKLLAGPEVGGRGTGRDALLRARVWRAGVCLSLSKGVEGARAIPLPYIWAVHLWTMWACACMHAACDSGGRGDPYRAGARVCVCACVRGGGEDAFLAGQGSYR